MNEDVVVKPKQNLNEVFILCCFCVCQGETEAFFPFKIISSAINR